MIGLIKSIWSYFWAPRAEAVEEEEVDDPVRWRRDLVIPAGLKPHQESGLRKLHELGRVDKIFLCDMMGSGKTRTAIAYIDSCLEMPVTRSTRFVVHPMTHRSHWMETLAGSTIVVVRTVGDLEKLDIQRPDSWCLLSVGLLDCVYSQHTVIFRHFLDVVHGSGAVFLWDEFHTGSLTGENRSVMVQQILRAMPVGVSLWLSGTPIRARASTELRDIFRTFDWKWDNDVTRAVDKLKGHMLIRTYTQLKAEGMKIPAFNQEVHYVRKPKDPDPANRRRRLGKRGGAAAAKSMLEIRHDMKDECFTGSDFPKIEYVLEVLNRGVDKMIVGVEHVWVQELVVRVLGDHGVAAEAFAGKRPTKRVVVTINKSGLGHNWPEYNWVLVLQLPFSPNELKQLVSRPLRMDSPNAEVHVHYVLTEGSRGEQELFDKLIHSQIALDEVTMKLIA